MKQSKITILLVWGLLLAFSSGSVFACYGAEALGMGGAYTALADGALAVYWNQAGLAFTDSTVEASHTVSMPQDMINYNHFAAGMYRKRKVGVGFGYTALAPWARDERWQTFGLGYRINENWAVGGAYRQVQGVYESFPYDSTGLDLSLMYRKDSLRLGLLMQDINGPSETNIYMKNIRPSVALETDKLTVGVDVYLANNLSEVFRGNPEYYQHQAGVEVRPWGKEGVLALRGGFYHGQVTAGVGLKNLKNGFFLDLVNIPGWEVTQMTAGIRF